MNIVVVGPGSIGTLWAYKLKQAGHKVSIQSRVDGDTLSLTLNDQRPVTLPNNHLRQIADADLILVTLKAWQVSSALNQIRSYIAPEAMILLLHNGMGTAESISQVFSSNPMLLGTTTHGAFQPQKHHSQHVGVGQTLIGAHNHQALQCGFIADVLNHALPECIWQNNIQSALWNKLAINCAINPLTALHNIRNGALSEMQYQETLDQIVFEVSQVMACEGFAVAQHALRQQVDSVIEKTAENYSSMQQDIFYQRPTEIDFISGYLLNCARKHSIETPANQKLYTAIKQIENTGSCS